jgi:hypothetical protein
VPTAITLLLLAARIARTPSLSDPVAGTAPDSLFLATPPLYLLLAPLFTLWDGASMLSMRRLYGLLIGLALLYLLWRALTAWRLRNLSWWTEIRSLTVSLMALATFLLIGAVWHRPMLSLAGVQPGTLVVDFHSHTNVSHDVRDTWMRGYDAEANRRWHRRAGFDAVFITDHNIASRESRVASREPEAAAGGPVLCPGIEISAWRAHIVLLGDTVPVDRRLYNASLDGLLTLLRVSDSAYHALSVASLPEFRRNHWERLAELVSAGLDGFEIVNASPKANELSRQDRDSVIGVARAHNRFVIGVSDSHGWGATSMVWNLLPGTPRTNEVCGAVLQRLTDGFSAVQVVERHRVRPDDWWPLWLTPVAVVWETWRGMAWPLTLAWLMWIWLLPLLGHHLSRRRAKSLAIGRSGDQDRP